MKRILLSTPLLLWSIGLLTAQTGPARSKAVIEGTVLSATTGQPLRGVRVSLQQGSSESSTPATVWLLPGAPRGTEFVEGGLPTATTDAGGRFSFTGVESGQYRIRADRNGFVPGEYGRRTPRGKGVSLSVSPGQRAAIEVRLTEAGVISGRVLDDAGEPVSGSTVYAYGFRYADGQRILEQTATAQTDDRGDYRLFWLQPGEYFVAATLTEPSQNVESTVDVSAPRNGEVSGRSAEGFVFADVTVQAKHVVFGGIHNEPRIFFPDSLDPGAAVAVNVSPASETRGIDFNVRSVPAATLRGRVLRPFELTQESGEEGELTKERAFSSRLQLNLVRRGDLAFPEGAMTAPVGANDEFEIQGVAPGSYDLTARHVDSGREFTGRIRVDVGSADVNNLIVELRPPMEVRGRIDFETAPPQGFDVSRLRVRLVPVGSPGGVSKSVVFRQSAGQVLHLSSGVFVGQQAEPGAVSTDGSFVISGVGAMEYRVEVEGLPAGAYLQAGRIGGLDALNAPFSVDANNANLQLLVGMSSGQVTGSVLDATRLPSPQSLAVLVPDAARRGRSDAYFTATAGQNGEFAFDNVPPGNYTLFAWEDAPDGAWQHPDFLGKYETAGIPIAVQPRGTVNADARLIPAP